MQSVEQNIIETSSISIIKQHYPGTPYIQAGERISIAKSKVLI